MFLSGKGQRMALEWMTINNISIYFVSRKIKLHFNCNMREDSCMHMLASLKFEVDKITEFLM